MATIQFHATGTSPLLQHNERLANPLDVHAREIAKVSKKRGKTIADHELLSKLEFKGGIYFDKELGPYVPGTWIDRALEQAGKIEKLGTAIKQSAHCVEDRIAIRLNGKTPKQPTIDSLWQAGCYDQRCVGVQRKKTLRTRPCFKEWQLTFNVMYDETVLEEAQIMRAMQRAGERIGIGDYRPRFGRFTVETSNGK